MKKLHGFVLSLIFVLVLFTGCTSANSKPQAPAPPPEPQAEAVQEPETPEPPAEPEEETAPEPDPDPAAEITYILNKNTEKFHKPACRSAAQISPKNYEETSETREEVLARGYTPCGNCKP